MKIDFQLVEQFSEEDMREHVLHSVGLGFPLVVEQESHERRLAIVGGGPSLVDHLEELREFTDIWAINGACRFLREHGIDSTLLSIDAGAILAPMATGATKALLATRCHPDTFETLKNADVTLFNILNDDPKGMWASGSTVSVVFQLATLLGYQKTVFYGCEGSFTDRSHAYSDEPTSQDYRFKVECGGKVYITAPDLYAVSSTIAVFFRRALKESFTERSGGLLRALIEHEENEIIECSPLLISKLTYKTCAECGQSVGHYDDCPVSLGVAA